MLFVSRFYALLEFSLPKNTPSFFLLSLSLLIAREAPSQGARPLSPSSSCFASVNAHVLIFFLIFEPLFPQSLSPFFNGLYFIFLLPFLLLCKKMRRKQPFEGSTMVAQIFDTITHVENKLLLLSPSHWHLVLIS